VRKVSIVRKSTSDQGTDGILTTDSGFSAYTRELPWRDNKHDVSCILPAPEDPPLVVQCAIVKSPAHGNVYGIPAPCRKNVLIHPYNLAGDTLKGFVTQALGCIGLGRSVDVFPAGTKLLGVLPDGTIGMVTLKQDQEGVTSSKDAVQGFMADLAGESFQLTISWDLKED
jgi:hypothetical protein